MAISPRIIAVAVAVATGAVVVSSSDAAAQRPTTLEQCRQQMTMYRQANAGRFQDARTGGDMEEIQTIRNEMRSMAAGCLKDLPTASVPLAQHGDLAELQAEAGQFDAAYATLSGFVADTSNTIDNRMAALEAVQRAIAEGGVSASVLSQMEQIVKLADSAHLGAARTNARVLLAQFSRGMTESKPRSYHILREAIEIAGADQDTASRTERAKAAGNMVAMIQQWAARDNAPQEVKKAREVGDRAFARYLSYRLAFDENALVGSYAPPIDAQYWINAPEGMTRQAFGDGNVYLIELTAHWCGICRMTYAPINALYAKYRDRGFRVVYATQFYGYFNGIPDIAPPDELDSLKAYIAGHDIRVPVAVAGDITLPARQTPPNNPNFENYGMKSLPELILVGKDGIIRNSWRGWSGESEAELDAAIQEALAAK